jgi:hypothetical protein
MQVETFNIQGPLLITPRVFIDDRGHFFESFSKELFKQHGIDFEFVQDNQSLSQMRTLRGLHFQAPPFDQGKLVRVTDKISRLNYQIQISNNCGFHLGLLMVFLYWKTIQFFNINVPIITINLLKEAYFTTTLYLG